MDKILESILKQYTSETAAKILKTALRMFAAATPEAVRMRDLAREAGVNLAAINYYFKSKDALYMELADIIVRLFQVQHEPFVKRFEEIKISENAKDAAQLIKDVLASRIRCESKSNTCFRYILLIIMREELCNGPLFKLFLKELFIPRTKITARLIEIATKGRISGERAAIAAKILFGQPHLFNTAIEGVKIELNWRTFGEKEAEKVRRINAEFIDKILK